MRHIQHVRDNCETIGHKLIELGKLDDGVMLIANGMIHDNSKFHGIEWSYLHVDVKEHNPEMFKLAWQQHAKNNPHHPEYWGSIHLMEDIFVAELVCDWTARSSEFGNDVHVWIDEKATLKYNFDKKSDVYAKIRYYLSLLLEKPFV